MGPFSGLMFLIGILMFVVGKNRNNDSIFRNGEEDRIQFMIIGIGLIAAAVVIWIFLLINGGEPVPLYDYSSYLNQNSSQ